MKNIVTFGEIMLRLTPPGFLRFSQAASLDVVYGGGESNVAVSLANFGLPVEFVSRIPANEIGECAVMEMKKRSVGTRHILRGGERLGIYFLEMGAMARGSKVVYDRAHSGMASITRGMIDWEVVFRDTQWFHWTGITPAISQGAAEATLEAIEVANRMGVTVSTDLNYRKNLWKYGKKSSEVMPDLVAGCDVILGNEEDAEKHFGIHPEGVDVTDEESMDALAYESVCRQLMTRFPRCKKAIITLRGSISASHNTWTGVLFNGQDLLTAPTYHITHMVDRVGGGDSFMGGLIYGLINYPDDQQALNFAVAASCLKHSIYGDANLVTVAEVQQLMKGDASGRVSR
ncbi:MAG: sugar kinase [Saprospiraceae bacterium]|nr:sugar kinase [Saprospiraceae bacterium]